MKVGGDLNPIIELGESSESALGPAFRTSLHEVSASGPLSLGVSNQLASDSMLEEPAAVVKVQGQQQPEGRGRGRLSVSTSADRPGDALSRLLGQVSR